MILLPGLVITATSAALALLFSFFLTRKLRHPLGELVKATQAISKRDFSQHIKPPAFRELEELTFSFNHMVGELKNFKQEVEKNSRNLEKIAREKGKELSYIYKISREVSSTLELNEVLDRIIRRTVEVLGLKVCTILLVEEKVGDRLNAVHAQGINLKKIEQQTLKRGEGISGWVWDKKRPLLIKDLNTDFRFIGRKKERHYTGSLISAPLEAKGKIIGVINANNKINGQFFKQDDLLLLKEIAAETAIAIENALLYKNLKNIYLNTISALASALEAKDHYSHSHSENVTRYSVAIAKKLGLSSSQIEIVRQATRLHDLGKIGIHDYILNKPGKLTPEEWEEVRLHSLRGAQILQPIGFLSEVAELVKQHHERYDGRGYPSGLCGRDTLLGARIIAIADAFDAMISQRPYRRALSVAEAVEELKANSGTQFDPEIVKIFLGILKIQPDLVKQYQ